jgi:hypothetical protein
LATGAALAKSSAKEAPKHSGKTPEPVQLPGHTRDETGKVADPRALHGDSKIEDANATSPTGERVVRPIPPTQRPVRPDDATQPPPFQAMPALPSMKPAAPSAVWPAPAMPGTAGITQPAPWTAPPAPSRIEASVATDSGRPSGAFAAPENNPKAGNAEPTAPEKKDPAERSQTASAPAETSRRASKAKDRARKSQPAKSDPAAEEPQPTTPEEPRAPKMTALDQIRLEIKSRLPYFQACGDAARRRAGLEIRRLQATWLINADGTIKELKIDGVPDAQLATCLTRAGSRPFSNPPGMDLTIPTPIVFAR